MATPDGGEGTSQYRGESSGTVKTLSQQITDITLDPPPRQPTNWESVLESLNLFVDAKSFPEVMVKDCVTGEPEMRPCYNLDDLWKSLNNTSIYGAGVPLMWTGNPVIQYFAPSLSGMQLYVDSPDPRTWYRACAKRSDAESPEKTHTGGSSRVGADEESYASVIRSSIAEAESSRKAETGGSSGGGANKKPIAPVLSSYTAEAESSRKAETGGSSGGGANKKPIAPVISSPTAKAESSRKSHTGGRSGGGADKESDSPIISSITAKSESPWRSHTSGIIDDSACKESDTSSATTRKIETTDFEADKESDASSVISSSTVEGEGLNSRGTLLIEYLERELPFNRLPLTDKITAIYETSGLLPGLATLTSIDLLPSSWIAVAWYPVYKVPSGLTLEDLDTAFLTFHFLSTRAKCTPPHEVRPAPARDERLYGPPSDPLRLSLPLFGLASYKLRGSAVAPSEPHEIAQENVLLLAAEVWLRNAKVYLQDFNFFRSQYFRRRR